MILLNGGIPRAAVGIDHDRFGIVKGFLVAHPAVDAMLDDFRQGSGTRHDRRLAARLGFGDHIAEGLPQLDQ